MSQDSDEEDFLTLIKPRTHIKKIDKKENEEKENSIHDESLSLSASSTPAQSIEALSLTSNTEHSAQSFIPDRSDVYSNVISSATEGSTGGLHTAGFSAFSSETGGTILGSEADLVEKDNEFDAIYAKYYPCAPRSKEVYSIEKHRKEIIEELFMENNSSRVTIIKGETGCGKTTLVPLYILDYIADNQKLPRKCNIWVTQPRRMAATSIASHVSRSRYWKNKEIDVGDLIGYQVGLDKCTSRDTRITYMTSGVAINVMKTNRKLDHLTHLIIDEVHERDMDIEMILLLTKSLLDQNLKLKVIIMSATVDTKIYLSYFKLFFPNTIKVKGRTFNVNQYYLDHIEDEDNANSQGTQISPFVKNAQKIAYNVTHNVGEPNLDPNVLKIAMYLLQHFDDYEQNMNNKGSVLIFVPGLQEMNRVQREINMHLRRLVANFDVYRVHSMLPRTRRDDTNILGCPPPGRRKIIISTIICESSITIPDVRYVIDFCLSRTIKKDVKTNLEQLVTIWSSEESSDQRSGRAGRTQPGVCFRLVRKKFLKESLQESVTPEIALARLENVVLLGKVLFPKLTPHEFLGMACEVPKADEITVAVKSLKLVGGLTLFPAEYRCPKKSVNGRGPIQPIPASCATDGDLTPLGQLMNLLPLELEVSRMIYYGYMLGFTYETIILAAGMRQEGFWLEDTSIDSKTDGEVKNLRAKLFWAQGSSSDPIAIMNAFLGWWEKMPRDYQTMTRHNRKRSRFIRPKWQNAALVKDRKTEVDWCQRHGINQKAIREMHIYIEDIMDRLESHGFMMLEENIADLEVNREDLRAACRHKEESYFDILKVIIAAGSFPHFYKLTHIQRDDKCQDFILKDQIFLNPLNTIYMCTSSATQSYSVGKAVQYYFEKQCGVITRMYFHKEKVFIEFDGHPSKALFEQMGFSRRHYNSHAEMSGGGRGNRVSISVHQALKMARYCRSLHGRDGGITVLSSRNFEPPEADPPNPNAVYLLDFGSKNYKIKFPQPRKHAKDYPIVISFVPSLICFWAIDSSDVTLRSAIQQTIADNIEYLQTFQGPIQSFSIVLAPFEGEYCRALVLSSRVDNRKLIQVRFVDFGNEIFVTQGELKAIPSTLSCAGQKVADFPGLAVRYRLRGVQQVLDVPSRYQKGFLPEDHEVKVSIFSTASYPEVVVDLWTVENRDETFQTTLISGSLAVRHPDSWIDIQSNHQWLGKAYKPPGDSGKGTSPDSESSTFDVIHLTDSATQESSHNDLLKEPGDEVELKGPYSPLMYEADCLFEVGRHMPVRPKPNSINSVICISDSEMARQSILLGNSVEMSSDCLSPKMTTLISNVPGIKFILYALFSPLYYVRTTDEKTDPRTPLAASISTLKHPGREGPEWKEVPSYCSFIAGLGHITKEDKKKKRVHGLSQFFPEYDVQMSLTAEFDDYDIRSINKLRESFSQMVGDQAARHGGLRNPSEIRGRQKRHRRDLRQLLQRARQTDGPLLLSTIQTRFFKGWPCSD